MCKKLSCLIYFAIAFCLAGYVSAAEIDVEIPAAVSQKPILDGVVDDVWLLSTEQFMTITIEGTDPESPEDLSGGWRALWDPEYLYVLIDINDESLVQDSGADSGWDDDRVEVFIDCDNSKGEETDGVNDYQYCFRWNNGIAETPIEWYFRDSGINKLEGVEYAVATTDDGYLFEIALPWSTMIGGPPRAGQLIGIDVMVDDDDDGGGRDSQISWHIEDSPPHSPVKWGTAFLVPEFPEKAYNPDPADGQIEISRDAFLSWSSGIYADKHNVYFGTVFDDVNDANLNDTRNVLAAQNQDDTQYDPPGLMDYNQTYYWRIDEVNEANLNSPWKGLVWSFTTGNFIIVEDFEDYNDYPPNEIWNTWIDGYGDSTNGSTAGYPDPDFNTGEHYVETNIVHSGLQSMPIFYNNISGISEVTKTLSSVRNWTQDGVVTLTLFYYGDAANATEPMYVSLNGSAVVNNPDTGAVLVTEWVQLDIPLQEFTDKGVNLTNVVSITIGFGNKAAPQAGGGSGHVFIDDIRLYRPE